MRCSATVGSCNAIGRQPPAVEAWSADRATRPGRRPPVPGTTSRADLWSAAGAWSANHALTGGVSNNFCGLAWSVPEQPQYFLAVQLVPGPIGRGTGTFPKAVERFTLQVRRQAVGRLQAADQGKPM